MQLKILSFAPFTCLWSFSALASIRRTFFIRRRVSTRKKKQLEVNTVYITSLYRHIGNVNARDTVRRHQAKWFWLLRECFFPLCSFFFCWHKNSKNHQEILWLWEMLMVRKIPRLIFPLIVRSDNECNYILCGENYFKFRHKKNPVLSLCSSVYPFM